MTSDIIQTLSLAATSARIYQVDMEINISMCTWLVDVIETLLKVKIDLNSDAQYIFSYYTVPG